MNFCVAFDEEDAEVGTYFLRCKSDLALKLSNSEQAPNISMEMHSKLCNPDQLTRYIQSLSGEFFTFAAYTHGGYSGLVVDGSLFLGIEHTSYFGNAFVYLISCLSGKVLGEHLIRNSCHCVFGFSEPIERYVGDLGESFVDCDNRGILGFLLHGETSYVAFTRMKRAFDQSAERMIDCGDPIAAGIFKTAGRSLIFLGREDLTLAELRDQSGNN